MLYDIEKNNFLQNNNYIDKQTKKKHSLIIFFLFIDFNFNHPFISYCFYFISGGEETH